MPNPIPNFHLRVSSYTLFGVLLVAVGLATFGDPAQWVHLAILTPIFKACSAMLSVALAVMVVSQNDPPAPPPHI